MKSIWWVSLSAILFTSCLVPKKKFDLEQAVSKQLRLENEALKDELIELSIYQEELNGKIAKLKDDLNKLKKDKTDCDEALESIGQERDDLQRQFENLQKQNEALLASSSKQRQKLMDELDAQRRILQDKEIELNEQQANIDRLKADIAARERKVNELEALLSKKDEAIAQLKANIEKALLSFDKDELSVEIKDGKIYVSLANKLLFKSGSTIVDKKGKDALSKLAGVLNKQKDIDILVEGHTDDDPIKTNCIADNWDLSVLRATSIVRILLDNKVDNKRIVPSGRGEFLPVATNETSDGKAKNRRTEIILAPNLDEIFKILESE